MAAPNPTPKLPTAALAAAVQWWSDQLSKPIVHQAGDLATSKLATTMAKDLKRLQPAVLQSFRDALLRALEEEPGTLVRLVVGRGPEGLLARASEFAQVDAPTLRFPLATFMVIRPDAVEVAVGFGSALTSVWKG